MTISNNLDVYAQEAWSNTLKIHLIEQYGKAGGISLFKEYQALFDYLMFSTPERALVDIMGLERCKKQTLSTQFERDDKALKVLNIYALNEPVQLSNSLAILQSMGLKVLLEKPKKISLHDQIFWVHRYQVCLNGLAAWGIEDTANQQFEELYMRCWQGNYAIDCFNLLLLSGALSADEIQIFRAYAAYLKQIKTSYSAQYIADALMINPSICRLLADQFNMRFNPDDASDDNLQNKLDALLNDVISLDQDTILKAYFELIMATCRTNYYQNKDQNKDQDNYQDAQIISFKIQPTAIIKMPKPAPEFEIFVYSKRFEGVHLRGGKVARGGVRWSDRAEDYRTEILGLMKAQMVKNSVIVPAGSKGGFICKMLSPLHDQNAVSNEVEQCYRLYIASLLQITDNLINGKIKHPENTVIYDAADPYLVVAADKGTANYSDIANEIAQQQHFWLDDAFASGGSLGYDHKKMGITARGAWESVKRHCSVIGINCQTQAFNVIGIGDMSGDVFGNGMLLSKKIQLLGAFNHRHIFIDPNPDVKTSYIERQRLFKLPRSGWNDYKPNLISQGGGVFKRSSKKINLSPQVQQLLDIKAAVLSPDELIHSLLKSQADVLWNGGIGTYVKSSVENNLDVQDKANDSVRVNASELNVKMMGEGGNLGITQLGRIEFAQLGGDIYTDAIDNSAGVDCSDHEVNIKILLQQVIDDGLLTTQQRNQLLASMGDEVAQLSLSNNIKQIQIIDLTAITAAQNIYEHARFISHLESSKVLSRTLEQLPSDAALKERATKNKGLNKPEIAVLLAYNKLVFKHALLAVDNFEGCAFDRLLLNYFPKPLREKYPSQIKSHALKNNIIATVTANQMVNQLGIGFDFKMQEQTSANIMLIAKAYLSVIEIFDINQIWQDVEKANNMPVLIRYRCFQTITGLIQRSISWILRNYPNQFDIDFIVNRFQHPIGKLQKNIYSLLSGDTKRETNELKKILKKHKAPDAIIKRLPAVIPLSSSFDIAATALTLNAPIDKTAKLFYSVAKKLDLQWLKQSISKLSMRTHWHQLAIIAMRNEVHRHQKNITFHLHKNLKNKSHIQIALDDWEKSHSYALARYRGQIAAIKNHQVLDFALLTVAINEVRLLSRQLSSVDYRA